MGRRARCCGALRGRGGTSGGTRAVGALARRHGGRPPAAPAGALEVRALEEVAVENAVEGCVREAYGAAVAAVQARAAQDAGVRAVMRGVARDEARHAALAWAVHEWAWARLGGAGRERVRKAMREALAELAEELRGGGNGAVEAEEWLGLPRDAGLIDALGEALVPGLRP